MLLAIGCSSLDELIDKTVPASIRTQEPLQLPAARTETEILEDLRNSLKRTSSFVPSSVWVTATVSHRR